MRRFLLSDVEATAKLRATGYLSDVLSAAKLDGEHIELSESEFQRLRAKYAAPQLPAKWPAYARILARIRNSDDAGIGDTIARVIGPVGGEAYKTWFKRLFGKPCGCQERQDELNRRYPYPV